MIHHTRPRITVVGAGPGDPGLITVSGLQALRSAAIVYYDALVNEALLAEAPARAPRIYVGKRAGRHSFAQEDINRQLVQGAYLYGHVVRLKGGDPFVFGRGHEELDFATRRGIEVRIIPGLSSATALPALQGVPVTRRGLSESFWVLTGTTRTGALSADIALAARSTATVVILMGLRKLREITELFRQYGRGDTPVMIVQNGSFPGERCLLGTVHTIADMQESSTDRGPGIIVIGEVASLHPAWQQVVQLQQAGSMSA